jgi:hypothetical protein
VTVKDELLDQATVWELVSVQGTVQVSALATVSEQATAVD